MHRTYLSAAIIVSFLIILSLLIIVPSALASTHYVAANGSDSNNGTSKSTPWLHASGMGGCAGNCASYTPVAGDSIILRGGDTWHMGNSAASPYVPGGWNWTWSGSSASSLIYVGVDQTWYSGSAWTRPILTSDNPTSTSTVGSCAYQVSGGNVMVGLIGIKFVQFDNFELTGFCWKENPSGTEDMYFYGQGASPGEGNGFIISNMYVHGWTHTAAATAGADAFGTYNQAGGVNYEYNVVDGSDSDDKYLDAFGEGRDAYIVQYNVIRHVGGSSAPNNCHILHDNLFEYINNAGDGSTHSDVFMCYGEVANGSSDPNLFYNNVFRYIGTQYGVGVSAVLWLFPPGGSQTDYVFNNVFHDVYGGGNYNNFCQVPSGPSCGPAYFLNNTMVAPTNGGSYSGCIICNGSDGNVPITSVNNHWITNGGTGVSAVFQNTTGVTESTPVYQTYSVATGQGYTSANDFAPTSGSDSTVGKGANNTSTCTGLPTVVQAACESATTKACSYNVSNHTVSCPNLTPVSRPSSGAWDVGAYEYAGGGDPPAPPTNLTAMPQ